MSVGTYATFRRGPGKRWFIWGRHETMAEALAAGRPVEVRRKDGSIVEVAIERLTTPSREGWCYAHPVGTITGEMQAPRVLPPTPAGAPQRMRRHGSFKRGKQARQRAR